MGTIRKAGSPAPGFGLPLLASAAVHLALVAALLAWGAIAAPDLHDAVQVALVEGAAFQGHAEGPETATPAERTARIAGIRPRAIRRAPQASTPAGVNAALPESVGRVSSLPGPAAPSPADGILRAMDSPVTGPGGQLSGEVEGVLRGVGIPGGGRARGEPMTAALPASPGAGSGGGSGAASGGGRDGAEIRRLRERIESRIVYPEEAIRRGQEGEVLLRIRVGEGGIPKEIRVARSSGARTLDEAARTGVARAAPLPSTAGWFEVPIRFSLR